MFYTSTRFMMLSTLDRALSPNPAALLLALFFYALAVNVTLGCFLF